MPIDLCLSIYAYLSMPIHQCLSIYAYLSINLSLLIYRLIQWLLLFDGAVSNIRRLPASIYLCLSIYAYLSMPIYLCLSIYAYLSINLSLLIYRLIQWLLLFDGGVSNIRRLPASLDTHGVSSNFRGS